MSRKSSMSAHYSMRKAFLFVWLQQQRESFNVTHRIKVLTNCRACAVDKVHEVIWIPENHAQVTFHIKTK